MNTGSRFERRFARTLPGAKRTPRSGANGGGDVSFMPGTLWSDWSFELKHRAKLPKSLMGWLAQAQADIAIGDRRSPALALQEDGGRIIVAFFWEDLQPWVEAVNEVGNASKLRSLVRQLKRQVADIEDSIR